jgi:hypothetical protein
LEDCYICTDPVTKPVKESSTDSSLLEDCCVCTDPVTKEDKIPCVCNSSVHRECVVKSGKSECPVCRRVVVLKPSEKKMMIRYFRKYRDDMAREEFRRFREEFGRNFRFDPVPVPTVPRRGYIQRRNGLLLNSIIVVIE